MKSVFEKVALGAAFCMVASFGMSSSAVAEVTAANRPPPVEVQLERYAGSGLEDEVECRQIQRTGTRIPWTVCLTEAEWELIREESVRTMRRLLAREET